MRPPTNVFGRLATILLALPLALFGGTAHGTADGGPIPGSFQTSGVVTSDIVLSDPGNVAPGNAVTVNLLGLQHDYAGDLQITLSYVDRNGTVLRSVDLVNRIGTSAANTFGTWADFGNDQGGADNYEFNTDYTGNIWALAACSDPPACTTPYGDADSIPGVSNDTVNNGRYFSSTVGGVKSNLSYAFTGLSVNGGKWRLTITDAADPNGGSYLGWEIFVTTVPAPQAVTAVGGTPQSAGVSTAFAAALLAKVTDSSLNPISGVSVTFAAPPTGASARFSGAASITVVTDAAGIAASPVPVANGTAGAYSVTASVTGLTAATFALTNTPGANAITFPQPADALLGSGTVALSATASSGLVVSYLSNTPAVCTVAGTSVTLISAGQCSVTASQPGNGTFAAAAPVTRTFNVLAPFLTGRPNTSLRNDYGGFVGMRFTVGASPLLVTQLGRWVVAGNAQSHIIKLVNASGVDLAGGSVALSLSGLPSGAYAFAPLSAPVTLLTNTSYYLVTQEFAGGDQWYQYGQVSANAFAVVNTAAYQFNGTYYAANASGTAYGSPNLVVQSGGGTTTTPISVVITSPTTGATVSGSVPLVASATPSTGASITSVQFKLNGSNFGSPLTAPPYSTTLDTTALSNATYTLTASAMDSAGNSALSAGVQITVNNVVQTGTGTPFLSGPPATALRRDYPGFVGLKFTVGSSPLNITQLGRWVVSGNNQTHIVKLVDAAGNDVPNGTASLPLSGAASGQFAYATLSAAIKLAANTSYYLMTQEFAGGDQWYDHGPVTAAAAAGVVNSAAYQYNGAYYLANDGASGYGVPSFIFGGSGGGSPPPTVNVTAPANGATVSATVPFTATAAASGGLSITGVQFKLNGNNAGPKLTSAPYTTNFDTTTVSNGLYTLTASATDSVGGAATSAGVQITINNGSTTGAPTALLTSAPTTAGLRNDYGDFVGFQFTVGNNALTVTKLGRWVAATGTQTHTVKLVDASGNDIAGGSASLSLTGAGVGAFVYAALSAPVTLKANTAYYLMTQEFAGGDKWFNYAPVNVTPGVATINGAAYRYNGNYYSANAAGTAYGSPNLLFQ